MLIGVPKEIKTHEYRVGLVPASIHALKANGHEVMVEQSAGLGIGIEDKHFEEVGATIVSTAKEIFDTVEMVVKVKEPQPTETAMLREGQILYTFLHLAPDPVQTKGLIDSGCSAIAYETVTDDYGGLPLLTPMSEVAGRMSVQAGAHSLEKSQGGRGVLMGGVPGVPSADVIILGGGVVGTSAIRVALGMEAKVTVIDRSLKRLRELDAQFGAALQTVYSTEFSIAKAVKEADLVIGAVLVPGKSAPRLVTKDMLSTMRRGAVVVDVAIDQGGCFESAKPTTHAEPTYVVDEVVHYCVANMPGAAARTSTFALNNATLPFAIDLANKGLKQALAENRHLRNGLNVHRGRVTYKAVAEDLNYDYQPAEEALNL